MSDETDYRVRGKIDYQQREIDVDSVVRATDEEEAFDMFIWIRAEGTYDIRYPEFVKWVDGPDIRPLSECERMEILGCTPLFAMENV